MDFRYHIDPEGAAAGEGRMPERLRARMPTVAEQTRRRTALGRPVRQIGPGRH